MVQLDSPLIRTAEIDVRPDAVRLQRYVPLAWTALLATTFPWNFTSPYSESGGGDTATDLVKLLILGGALLLVSRTRERGTASLATALLVGYAAVALVAALLPPISVDGAIRAARLAIVVVTACWIGASLDLRAVLRGILWLAVPLGGLALAGALSGLGIQQDRLHGFLPFLHPNVLASIVGLGLLAAVALWAQQELSNPRALASVALSAAALSMTGSRTALAATALGVLVVLGAAFARSTGRVLLLVWVGSLAVIGAAWVAVLTELTPFAFVSELFTRGGTATIDPTLTGRTAAWELALNTHHDGVRDALGQGLQVKTVARLVGDEVLAQGIDNTWISGLVAAGWIGATLLVAAMVVLLGTALARRAAVPLAVLVVVLSSSWTESSLADVSFALVCALTCSVAGIGRSSRHGIASDTRGTP